MDSPGKEIHFGNNLTTANSATYHQMYLKTIYGSYLAKLRPRKNQNACAQLYHNSGIHIIQIHSYLI